MKNSERSTMTEQRMDRLLFFLIKKNAVNRIILKMGSMYYFIQMLLHYYTLFYLLLYNHAQLLLRNNINPGF